jgi:hypothetical protein
VQGLVQIVQCRSNSYRGRLIMLEEYFGSSSTLQRNERVKLVSRDVLEYRRRRYAHRWGGRGVFL